MENVGRQEKARRMLVKLERLLSRTRKEMTKTESALAMQKRRIKKARERTPIAELLAACFMDSLGNQMREKMRLRAMLSIAKMNFQGIKKAKELLLQGRYGEYDAHLKEMSDKMDVHTRRLEDLGAPRTAKAALIQVFNNEALLNYAVISCIK